ncbi:hypothetical protein [Mesorhizobium sp. SP-1A]|uniref:hypothetical protein n=1 Tax=Mesorhizobium sp. SP-1A TaxID=3077840 RepID=UPI0028F7496A|nr:hypothetical protein [Mesorhizobium sp. SP-1A]
MFTETVRNRIILAIVSVAALFALAAAVGISTGLFQSLLFCAMAMSAAILTTLFVVAAN